MSRAAEQRNGQYCCGERGRPRSSRSSGSPPSSPSSVGGGGSGGNNGHHAGAPISPPNSMPHHAVSAAATAAAVAEGPAPGTATATGATKKSTAKPRPAIQIPPRGIGPVYETNHHDVLCGRGGRINAYAGNVLFRELVAAKKAHYLAPSTKKLEKAHIAAQIVAEIRAYKSGGRFLKGDPDGTWFDIGDAKAIKKVGQALREDAPKVRDGIINTKPRGDGAHSSDDEASPAPPDGGCSESSSRSSRSSGSGSGDEIFVAFITAGNGDTTSVPKKTRENFKRKSPTSASFEDDDDDISSKSSGSGSEQEVYIAEVTGTETCPLPPSAIWITTTPRPTAYMCTTTS